MHGNPGPGRDFHFRSDTDIHLSTVSSDGESRFHARGVRFTKTADFALESQTAWHLSC